VAYYDSLIAAWNSATQPPTGVTGSGLVAGDTTAQKVAKINGWTVATPIKVVLPATDVYNAIVLAEYNALAAASQQAVVNLMSMGTLDASPGTHVRSRFVAIFPNTTQTFTNLSQLVAPFDNDKTDWCLQNGYPSHGKAGPGNLSVNDASNAGLV
jgi:hypothetical protein